MTSKWTEQELGNLLETVIDHRGRTPKKLGGDFTDHGIPVISARNVKKSQLTLNDNVRFIDPALWDRWMPVKLQAGDVLLTSEAPLGETAYLFHAEPLCIGQRLFALRARPEKLHGRYLFYALQAPTTRNQILARASGTTAQGIRQAELVRVPLHLPPLPEQKRIAGVLGPLDDKIENNRRLTANLQDTVICLFQARFMDFVGRDDLVKSDAGLIPRGWSIAPLSDLVSVHREFTKGASDLPYIGLDDMPRGSTVLADWKTTETPTGQSAIFFEGDILFGKLRPYFRKAGVAPIDGRCSTEILVLRPDDPSYYGVLLGHVSSQQFIDHCVAVSRGTRMPRAEWKDAGAYSVVVPTQDAAAAFTVFTKTVYGLIRALVQESRTLAAMRDLLLPRLVSGQIRIPPGKHLAPEDA
jgi:type I restriction enzyme, S subunit